MFNIKIFPLKKNINFKLKNKAHTEYFTLVITNFLSFYFRNIREVSYVE